MADNAYSKTSTTEQLSPWFVSDNASLRADPQVEHRIRLISPSRVPFTMLMESLESQSEPIGNMTFQTQQEWDLESKMTVATAATATATSIVVNSGSPMVRDDVLHCPRTGENILGESISTNTITAKRSIGAKPGAALVVGDILLIIGSSAQESANKPDVVSRGTASKTRYCQHQMVGLSISDWANLTAMRGIGELDRLTKQKIEQFRKKREDTFMLGQAAALTDTTTALPRFFASGMLEFAETYNRMDLNGNLTYDTLTDAVQHVFDFGESETRWAFASRLVLNRINGLAEVRESVRRVMTDREVGFNVDRVFFPGGATINFVRHPVLEERGLDEKIIIIDLAAMRRKVFSPLDKRADIEANGSYRHEVSWAINEGLDIENEMAAGVIENAL